MVYRNNEPYNDLPFLPPAAALETTAVLRRAITASRALAELKGAGNLIPNQSILINSIPLEATTERCRQDLPGRVYSKELMELIFTQPYVRIQTVMDAGLARRDAASDYLRELERIGVLQAEKHGREVLYRHPALLEVLKA